MTPRFLPLGLSLALALACTSGEKPPGAAGAAGASGGAGSGAGVAGTGVAGTGVAGTNGAAGTGATAGASGAAGAGGTGTGAAGTSGAAGASATPDGGTAGAPAVDAAAADASALACVAGLLCFDFEGDPAGGKPGTGWTGQGTIDGAKAAHGKNSLRVLAGGDGAFATLKPAGFFPPADNEYYGRVLFWVDALPSSHWTFVRSKGPVAGKGYTAEYTYGGTANHFIANYDTQGVASDCWKDAGNVPRGKWSCMEWHFKGATNELELWVDGVADAKAHVVGKGDGCIANGTAGTWYAPTFNSLELGFAVYGGGTAFSVWYDDLALAKSRVGCP